MNYYEILGISNITGDEDEIQLRSYLLGKIINKYFNNDEMLTNEHLILELMGFYVKRFNNEFKESMDIIAVGDNTEEENNSLLKSLVFSHTMSALRQITGLDTGILPEKYPNLTKEDLKAAVSQFDNPELKGIVMKNYLMARTKLENQNSKQEYDKHLREAMEEDSLADEEVFKVVNEGRFRTFYSGDNNGKIIF